MERLVADNIERLIAYTPGKPIEELERELGISDVIKLASNENPVGPSPKVLEAIALAAPEIHRYPDAIGFALKTDLCAHHDVRMDELCLGNGSNELIDIICRTFTTPDEHIVFGDPSFVCYWLGATAANAAFTKVPLRENLYWDVDAMLGAVTPKTKVLFLANPNNPTGTHLDEAGLRRLLSELPPSVVAVIDEAYVQFADADDFESALAMRGLRERLIVLRTFSKAYGLASLRVGYAIAKPELIDFVNRVRAPFNTGAVGQAAARAALEDAAWMERYVEMNRVERARVSAGLVEAGLTVAPSQTNFVLADFGRPGKEIYDALLRKGVIIRPMPKPIDTWLRITIGLPEENDRLLQSVKDLPR
jgi:histidinol-phosphate aminotransferase